MARPDLNINWLGNRFRGMLSHSNNEEDEPKISYTKEYPIIMWILLEVLI